MEYIKPTIKLLILPNLCQVTVTSEEIDDSFEEGAKGMILEENADNFVTPSSVWED